MRSLRLALVVGAMLLASRTASPFSAPTPPTPKNPAAEEAARLLRRAKEIRESIPESPRSSATARGPSPSPDDDPSATPSPSTDNDPFECESLSYRLYVDIGREDGTWMDPRWGASGRRIEFTCDVDFAAPCRDETTGRDTSLADQETAEKMVKDNFGGRSSPVRILRCASQTARLRGGFDSMECRSGAYRIDAGGGNGNGSTAAVVRFCLDVAGTAESGPSSFGDVSIPRGCLYFSLPLFGNSVSNLSSREGPVTVRQVGWHTGWRRQESRIVGTFRAKPIEEARRRDRY